MGSLDGLPIDILRLIVEKIVGHADVLRFGAVSRKFRSFVMDNLHSLPSKLPLCLCVLPSKPPPLPLLMQCNDNEWENINFFSISDGKRHGEFLVPEIRNKWPVGSRYGWLFTVDTQGRSIQLLNPLTRAQIPLPSLDAFEHPTSWVNYDGHTDFGFVLKAVISSDPSNKRRNLNGDDDCILVIAIITMFEVLSFCRVGDDKWTNVEGSPLYIKDVIWYKGEVYAVDGYGVAVVYDFAGDKTIKQIAYSPDDLLDCERYLVVLTNGDLLQVVREREYERSDKEEDEFLLPTCDFVVYKLEVFDEPVKPEGVGYSTLKTRGTTLDRRIPTNHKFKFKWVEMENLGDHAIFVGQNYSFCVPAGEYQGCKPNCIYFTDHGGLHSIIARGNLDQEKIHEYSACDMAIYNFKDKHFEEFTQLNDRYHVPPIWITPNPW
ncbi:uncharacterized protein A4U43_C06F12160 [Asparagus officinalis]|uniref:KIB1-4 beta-propeller domain-containing protein n=1 Tax=Asparagus officinalis TaxID=4686 RepID=A0A5P1ELC5_ASPOF|nr:F-box protein At2g26160-like [Asparagus officinalis]ONK66805.1 uncharacterized protein A4U43_C06F12160 [Asparagus officinalis]